jgi:hypothetical protein
LILPLQAAVKDIKAPFIRRAFRLEMVFANGVLEWSCNFSGRWRLIDIYYSQTHEERNLKSVD